MDVTEVLVRLQEADTAEARARRRLEEMPEKQAILALRRKIEEAQTVKSKVEAYLGQVERALSRQEDDVAQLNEKIEAEGAKVLSGKITNPKELQNISRELDSLKRRRETLENQAFTLMEKQEAGREQASKVETALAELAEREAKLVEEFKQIGGSLQSEINSRERRRKELAGMLTDELLRRYEALCQSKSGIAVGVLEGGQCTACRFELPAESVKTLKGGADLATCPTCKRILVIRVHEEAVEQ